MERIRRIRDADKNHNFTLVCRDLSEIARYARVDNRQYRTLRAFTPGPYTFLLEATREVYRGARAGLRDSLEPAEIDTGLAALEALAATFKRTLREVGLVEEALQGRMWRPRL